jgi:multiple sugar transport system substrate-binding protein
MDNSMQKAATSRLESTETSSVSRQTFLSTAAKAAGGIAVGGSLLQATRGSALADQARMRSIGVLRKPTVTLVCAWQGNANEVKAMQTVFDKFHAKNAQIKVNVQLIPSNSLWGVYFEKILTMIAGGNSPDIGRVPTEGVLLAATKNLLLPLDSMITHDAFMDDYFNDVPAKLTDSFRYKGKLLGLPVDWNDLMITYNTAIFKKLGIPQPGPNWTGDDFRSIAKKIQASGPYGFIPWAGGTFFVAGWVMAAGGSLYNKDLTKSNATDPANVKALQLLQDLIYKDKSVARPNGQDFALEQAGRVGMIAAGRWAVNTYEVANFHDYNAQLLPKIGPNRKEIFGVGALPIFRQSKYPEEAFTAMKYVLSREAMSIQTKLGNSNPPRRSMGLNPSLAIPPGNPGYNYKVFFDALAAAQPVPAPPQFNELEVAINAGYTKLLANEVDAATMLKALDTQLNTILAKKS